jgi:hypothetical protein
LVADIARAVTDHADVRAAVDLGPRKTGGALADPRLKFRSPQSEFTCSINDLRWILGLGF